MGEYEFHVDADLVEAGTEAVEDLVHDIDFPDFVEHLLGGGAEYDLIGADPDEEGLWDQLMLDMDSAVNPYVAN
jgi:hypothetical protein